MTNRGKGKLVILSGPSCVGKSPLAKALARFYPDLAKTLPPIVLFNSRSPRPGEQDGVDYHFRTREHIAGLRDDDRYVVEEVRSDLLALDLKDLAKLLKNGNAFYEGNPVFGRILQTHPALKDIPRLSIFISPLAKEEILFLREQPGLSLADLVADVMRRKLLRRTRRHKGELSLPDLEEIERRCTSAYRELKEAHHFDHVLPNHDGEDSENWDAFYYPLGDARQTLCAVVALLQGQQPVIAEKWEAGLLPS